MLLAQVLLNVVDYLREPLFFSTECESSRAGSSRTGLPLEISKITPIV